VQMGRQSSSSKEITAAVVHREGAPFQIERVCLAEPGPGEVLVRIKASGICQTDIHARDGYFFSRYPAVYGHEGAGIVERVGSGVEEIKSGDSVIMVFPSCGSCVYCSNGNPAYCLEATHLKFLGTRGDGSTVMTLNGSPVFSFFFQQSSFATYSLTTERNVVKVPGDLPLELLAAIPCGISTGTGAVLNVLKPQPGDAFAVFGTGTVGLAALMAAQISGCEPIIAVDAYSNRLEIADSLGATHTINAVHSDPVAAIRKITGGRGVQSSLEAAGSPQTLQQALDCLKPMGSCCLVGSTRKGTEASINMNTLQNGRTVRGCIQGDGLPQQFVPRLISLYRSGKLPIEKLVHFYRLADINQAIADSMSGKTIKPVVRMAE
jgi:aryl-alcohol dehydrogenase